MITSINRNKFKIFVLLFLFYGAVFIVLLEAFLRNSDIGQNFVQGLYNPQIPHHLVIRDYLPNTTYRFSPPDIRRANPGGEVLDVYDIQTDRAGFIMPGRLHDDPDLTIAFIGGSTTECMYVQPELRFPYLVGRQLEKELGIKVNTLNAGRSGNHSMHGMLQMIAKIIPEQPDIVVVMNNTNDRGVLNSHGTYWNNTAEYKIVEHPQNNIISGLRMLRDTLLPYSYRAFRRATKNITNWLTNFSDSAQTDTLHDKKTAPAAKLTNAEELEQEKIKQAGRNYESSMKALLSTAQAWGITPVVMSQPLINEDEWLGSRGHKGDFLGKALSATKLSYTDFRNHHDYFDAIALRLASDLAITHIDLAHELKWTKHEIYDGLHYTDAGSILAAKKITAVLHELWKQKRY